MGKNFASAAVPQPSTPRPFPADDAFRVAHRDASAVYGELRGYRITIEMHSDGWHVEFDLTKLNVAGGGPRYVIDPATGAIVSKVYEQ
jgi:hypothetical protein